MPLHKASTTSKKRKGPMKIPVFVVNSDGILVDVYLRDRNELPEPPKTSDQDRVASK
jgi:hypothetical protein